MDDLIKALSVTSDIDTEGLKVESLDKSIFVLNNTKELLSTWDMLSWYHKKIKVNRKN